jgi:hypothetical protein
MLEMDRDSVQPGWTVWTSDGKRLGQVIAADTNEFQVKKEGILGGTVSVPKSAVAEVETGRVELDLTEAEIGKS